MDLQDVKKCPLFADIKDPQLEDLLKCLTAARRAYKKDSFIFREDGKAASVGLVLSGSVYVIKEDFWGNRVIFADVKPGGLFGEALACARADKLPVSVVAAEKSEIMLMDYRKLVTSCTSACIFHTQVIQNMLQLLAQQNIMLIQKMEHLAKRTTREKVMSFLSSQAAEAQSTALDIPFNRQDLADYLCVDRSALSRELGLMQKEGLLRYDKNHFELLRNDYR